MINKTCKLKFRAVDKEIFSAIKMGKKKIETRVATERYRKIEKGDRLRLICGREEFIKEIVAARVFPTIAALLKKYRPSQINPAVKTEAELRKMYDGFSGYRDKIKKYGLAVWELK